MTRLPKVELHLHLDCSLSYSAVFRLNPAISRAEYDAEFVAPPQCASLADFLTRAPRGFQLMQTRDALRLVTEDLFAQLAADGVLYAELRFAPLLHLLEGLTPEAVVATVDRATEDSIAATGIEARLILCTLRHYSQQQSLETAQLVEHFRGSHVVALDIAGDEAGYPIDAHIPAFHYAAERGLARTAHAGEARGADSVWGTLRAFAPARIGHGVRSIEDPALVDHLRRERIHLEVCPSSNVQTRTAASYAAHAVDRLFRAGVSLGISTDTRTITNVTLEQEYARLREHFAWTDAELMTCNREALRAAFIDDPTRQRLLARLNAGFPIQPAVG
ncbi:MAG TPA: adenosine deaminase [Acidobacteriaceae bacterium]|jgi:adenosine deaminase|nr:adenosine deaminase [Acidobacteriaceae bacterium]